MKYIRLRPYMNDFELKHTIVFTNISIDGSIYWVELIEWCEEQFGKPDINRWNLDSRMFELYFDKDEDLTLFILSFPIQ